MKAQPKPVIKKGWWQFRNPKRYLRLLALPVIVLVVVVSLILQLQLAELEAVAYPAIFLISLVGNATLFLPAPTILSICEGGRSLNPLIVGLVAGVAMSLGESTGYLAGYSGSGLAKKNRLYERIEPWMRRKGWVVVLMFAAIPNPLFDIAGLAAGAIRMPLWQFLGATWAGKTIRSIGLAYFGLAYGCLWWL